jgi:hypothetical protein
MLRQGYLALACAPGMRLQSGLECVKVGLKAPQLLRLFGRVNLMSIVQPGKI